MSQIFIIIGTVSSEVCYWKNEKIDQVIDTFSTHYHYKRDNWDNDVKKHYIGTCQVDVFTKICDKLGFTWSIAITESKHSEAEVEKYLSEYRLRNKNQPNTERMEQTNDFNRINFIRIKRLEDMIRVELPMSMYSYHHLYNLKKSYSLDSYAWNFIGENNIRTLFKTCSENNIGIIEEIKTVDHILKNLVSDKLN